MASRTPLPVQPNLYMTDTAGRPLDGGKVYFGESGKDPELYPIDIFYDELLTIAAPQPVITKNGFLSASGSTIGIYGTADSYSVKVLDANGVQVLYLSDMKNSDSFVTILDAEIERSTQEAQVIKQDLSAINTDLNQTKSALEAKNAELQGQIDGIGGGKFAYTTYAKMIAASALPSEDPKKLPVNASIDIINDPDGTKNGTYAYDGTTFTKSPYDPLTLAKTYTDIESEQRKNIISDDLTEKAFSFVDENGHTGVSIDLNANIEANNITVNYTDGIALGVKDEQGGYSLVVESNGNFRTALTDKLRVELDRVLAKLGISDGDIVVNDAIINLQKTDYMHLFSYGQSLSRGQTALPILSTTQPYENVTFLSGVLPRGSDVTDYTGFKPLVEMSSGVEGETPISSMANDFVGYQVANGDSASNWKMVGTAPGRGARDIAKLSKGLGNYTGLMEQVQAAYDLAQAQGKTYSVWAMAWTQGETDLIAPATSQDSYYNMLIKLRDDFDSDVKAITGQIFSPLTVMYQTCSHKKYEEPNMYVALAQLQAAENNANIVMATPIYFLDNAPDTVHLTNNSSVQLGKYYAKALDYTLKNKDKWQPLKPKHITRQGKILSVEFNKSGLTLDSTLVTITHNHGFDLFSNGALLDIITNVEVVDTNRVNITLSAIPPDGTKLAYGKGRSGDPATSGSTAGARGNLRDNAGDVDNYVDSNGNTRYMHNWCVFFEKSI